ncbi:MAG: pyridoxal phosphate-dependent aminotransferase [Sarcina sp.]
MKNLSVKAKKMAASLTLELTAKAASMRKEGKDVISFGVGEPDFNTPKNVREAAHKAIEEGKSKYTAASGLIELKEEICKKLKKDNKLEYNTSQIVISTGAKQCLNNVFMAILNPGDEVIVPSPYWVSYPELISLADGEAVFVETKKENAFKLIGDEIEQAVTNKTKAIIINSPNNPTGAVYTEAELLDILDVCEKYDLYIISDEIYEKLNYFNKENPHVSIASFSESAKERTIVINGFSKSHAMTGWRIGYSASNNEIAKLMSTIQSHTTSNPNTIAQYASMEALIGDNSEFNQMFETFTLRRNLMVELLDDMENIDYINPMGAFYCFIDISKVFNDNIKTSFDFSRELLEKENVMVIPGIAFGNDNYIRLSYATSEKNIKIGLERIKKFINSIA